MPFVTNLQEPPMIENLLVYKPRNRAFVECMYLYVVSLFTLIKMSENTILPFQVEKNDFIFVKNHPLLSLNSLYKDKVAFLKHYILSI